MAGGVRIDGLSDVVRALSALGFGLDDLKDGMSDISSKGAQLASSYAPRQTGRLAGDVRGNRAKSKAVVTVGRTTIPYAGPINYGWAARNIAASGFMQRADKALAPYAVQRLEQAIDDIVRKQGLQ